MDKATFYDAIRTHLFGGHLSQSQVDGIEAILTACAGIHDQRQVAYILATIYHECDKKMQPIEEYGKGKGHPYGRKVKRIGQPYTTPDQIYYGRGYVQLTWFENYAYQSKLLGIDLLNHPELALQPDIAAKILIHGMLHGDFTGHFLDQYFNKDEEDFVSARKIINGLDMANNIAGYALIFYRALTSN